MVKSMNTSTGLLLSGALIAAAVVAPAPLPPLRPFAGTAMSIVLPAWWLVTVATGEPDTTLSLLCAIFAVSWMAGVGVLTRRS